MTHIKILPHSKDWSGIYRGRYLDESISSTDWFTKSWKMPIPSKS